MMNVMNEGRIAVFNPYDLSGRSQFRFPLCSYVIFFTPCGKRLPVLNRADRLPSFPTHLSQTSSLATRPMYYKKKIGRVFQYLHRETTSAFKSL